MQLELQILSNHSEWTAAVVEAGAAIAKLEMADAQAEKSLGPRPLASCRAWRGQIALAVLVDPYCQLRLIEHQLVNRDFPAGERQDLNRYIDMRSVEERRRSRRLKAVQRQVVEFCAELSYMKMEAAEFHARACALFDLAHHHLAHPALHNPRFDQKQTHNAQPRHREKHESQPAPPAHDRAP
jgi:hypothetical protein